jgi:hypothetical protein
MHRSGAHEPIGESDNINRMRDRRRALSRRGVAESAAVIGEPRLSVSVRKGATFSVQLGPPQWLRVESFEEA